METGQTPFIHRHVISWGECDPAGIIYTPRVIDFVVEAIEAWYPAALGITWTEMRQSRNTGVPMVRAKCDFIKAPVPDLELFVEVRVAAIGRSSITFTVTGRDGAGDDYFRARMVSCYTDLTDVSAKEIDSDLRERMVAYQTSCNDS